MSAALEIVGVRRRYGATAALDGVDLAIEPGTVLALLGPNGAGKSTLVRLCAGLERPNEGTVRVLGEDPRRSLAARRRVGVAPQEIGIYPQLTVAQNLRAFGEAAGLRRRDARTRAEELLEPFALSALADRTAGRLSGGEQRRLHTAAALVHRPSVILLDEPTAGADPATREGILDAVLDLAADGAAVLYTTHYLPEVERLDARVAILEQGRVIVTGTVAGLIAAHGDAALVLRFTDGPVPVAASAFDGAAIQDNGTVTVRASEPAEALRALLNALGPDSSRLADVAIVQPSLEAAYLALTGRAATDSGVPDLVEVPA
ncbi:Linearmycin resistance ATP-binding protein LnrL [Paraconexibacter sp. AEG42_29]|uniref:Linearmycin resistance ATP-binding protein LnrL n=1 Tax=Paraconexibacter sp. AEG42_29 TaxID=2997339 RepID=A0AAU7B2D5_9ACTN